MKARLVEHILSIILVTSCFVILVVVVNERESTRRASRTKTVEPYLKLNFLDFGNPLHAALFKETLGVFRPDARAENDSLLQAIQRFRQEQFASEAYKSGAEERGLSAAKLLKLGSMYLRFILIYLVVMVLSYHAAQSLAIFRFVRVKQHRASYIAEMLNRWRDQKSFFTFVDVLLLLCKALMKAAAYVVLFAPAYVIAYSIRSSFDTDSYLFLVALGVLSNGLLINSANKFFTFLVGESRKGYVQTAIVKNLDASYDWHVRDGIPSMAVLHPKSLFPSHVFRHIYLNARYQYLPALKEHASFLVTGLIIIEMALNIQGHLGYELLQSILYKRYEETVAIILAIFFLVKTAELIVDTWFFAESRRYENKA